MTRAPLVGLIVGSYAATFATPAHAAALLHSEPLRAFRAVAQSAERSHERREPLTLHFNAFSRDFALELEPNARLAAMETRLGLPPGTAAYRGKLAGRPDSWARVVLTPAGPAGIVYDGATLYGLELAGDSVAAGSGARMFRLADVYFTPGELACASAPQELNGAQAVAAMVQEFTALRAAGATVNLDLGAVADFEFAETFGANAEAALLTRFNNVDGIFSEQLGVQITVARVDVFTVNNDPFTTSAASALLDELANYRGATPAQDAQGLTYLFTGRDLDGSTAGIAYLGSVCARRSPFDTRSFGVGLSEGRRGATVDSLVAAHEIGHNFGAPHDAEAGSACAATAANFIMSPSITGSDQFSACSIAQMQPEIASATCLEPITGSNVAATLAAAQPALVGVDFMQTATVTSLGTDAANGVVLTASTASGLELRAADAGTSTCTVSPATATCNLGTLTAGAARDVTFTLRATGIGALAFSTAVTATQDNNSADDNAAVSITAAPVVDLVVAGTATDVEVNQAVTVNATLLNAADFGATNVALTALASAGLRPDQASLGGTACSITGQNIVCPTRALAARANVTFTIAATGLAVGSQQLTIGATASESERAASDNQAAVAVNVRAAAPPAEEDGGAGASGWGLLGLLAAWAARRRARLTKND